jgi:hypothetical protein
VSSVLQSNTAVQGKDGSFFTATHGTWFDPKRARLPFIWQIGVNAWSSTAITMAFLWIIDPLSAKADERSGDNHNQERSINL